MPGKRWKKKEFREKRKYYKQQTKNKYRKNM
jgi:hypothetical protein